MSAGTYYVVVSRSGAAAADAYRIGLREAEAGFSTADVLYLYDGSSWIGRSVLSGLGAALALRIYAQRVTTTQIEDIVSGVGDWLAGTGIRTASGLRTQRYRSEEQAATAQSEIKALLDFGTSGNARLLARVTVDRVLQVDAAPSAAEPGYTWSAAGGLRDRYGVALPEVCCRSASGWRSMWRARRVCLRRRFWRLRSLMCSRAGCGLRSRSEQPIQAMARLARESALPDLASKLRPLL